MPTTKEKETKIFKKIINAPGFPQCHTLILYRGICLNQTLNKPKTCFIKKHTNPCPKIHALQITWKRILNFCYVLRGFWPNWKTHTGTHHNSGEEEEHTFVTSQIHICQIRHCKSMHTPVTSPRYRTIFNRTCIEYW